EYIRHNQTVAQAPQQPGFEPAEGQQPQQHQSEKTQDAYPPAQSLAVRHLEQPQEPLQCEQKQVQTQQITSSPGQAAGGQQTCCQKAETHCAQGQIHGAEQIIDRTADLGPWTSDLGLRSSRRRIRRGSWGLRLRTQGAKSQ